MFKMILLFALQWIFVLVFPLVMKGQTINNGWHGIKPLYSSKEDVERILGKPIDEELNLFETENEKITVLYSKGFCNENKQSIWNVPKDTILTLLVSPKTALNPSDFFGKSYVDFERTPDIVMEKIFNYSNSDGSIKFQTKVLSSGVEDIIYILYTPREKDNKLKCKNKSNSIKPKDGILQCIVKEKL